VIPILLASKSAARAALLAGAGVPFAVASADVDEDALKIGLKAQAASPRDIAVALARRKAVEVSQHRTGLVIGADQTLELAGELFDKAQSVDELRTILSALRGRRHQLHAAVTVADAGAPIWSEVVTANLTMRAFTDAYLDAYLRRNGERLLSCVGGYELEGEGLQLFDAVDGDFFSILGLPMLGLLALLRERGAIAT
jgi:septum formation protein